MRLNKYLQLHIIILLWGFTPVLGKLISLQADDLVWYRLVIAGVSLYLFMRWKGVSLKTKPKQLAEILLIGFVVGLHWFAFYHAIKISNVSVTMAGFATITLFGSLLQPILLKKKFFWGDLIYGLIIAAGLLVIINFEQFYLEGIMWGVVAAFTGAFFGIYNGKLIRDHDSTKITLIEFGGALLIISLSKLLKMDGGSFVPFPDLHDWIFLLFLSILCTTVAFTWSIQILKKITPLTVIITNNLEPVYGIVFSVLLFTDSEYMSFEFYVGAVIILISVFTYPFIQRRFNKE